jgi:uncharacterized DUF497 family protein
MTIDFDPPKSLKNARERGLSFEAIERCDWETCLLGLSPRQEMTATRFLAVGFLDEDLVVVVFTIHAAGIRVISSAASQPFRREILCRARSVRSLS